jgi:hypothetical protein
MWLLFTPPVSSMMTSFSPGDPPGAVDVAQLDTLKFDDRAGIRPIRRWINGVPANGILM